MGKTIDVISNTISVGKPSMSYKNTISMGKIIDVL